MFELAVAVAFAAALIPPLYLFNRVVVLRKRIEQALAAVRKSDQQMDSLISAQCDLLGSFDVFDSLLACFQESCHTLDTVTRSFVSVFRERTSSYIERGCEGSLLINTHLREDRLKQLALELVRRHQADFAHGAEGAVRHDALDNGDFSEYLKLMKYLVQGYCCRSRSEDSVNAERRVFPFAHAHC